MTRRRWLLVVALAGATIFALSFVNAWVVHEREVRGEGYRFVHHFLSAWRGVGIPVLTVGALLAMGTGAVAGHALLTRRRPPGLVLVAGAALAFGLLASAALPVAQDGHASSVDLRAGPLLPVVLVLGALLLAGSAVLAAPNRVLLAAAALLVAGAMIAGWGGRWLGLQWAEGTGRHWSDGSYTRTATEGQPTETLTIGDGRVQIGDRWSGAWDWSGWTIVIADDPACPDARGTYHAHDAGDENLRFVMVVDPCRDGERADDLQTGIWVRDR